MALKDGWFADRSPGGGKVIYTTAGNPATATPVGGLIGIGASGTPPASPSFPSLPATGSTIPPAGSADRAAFFLAFKSAVGFDGETALYGWTAGTDSADWSLSAWLNYGVTAIAGWTPDPNIGNLYAANYDNPFSFSPLRSNLNFGSGGGGGRISAGTNWSSSPDGGPVSWPSDGTTNAGWVHVMASFRASASTFHDRYQVYLNDTAYTDVFQLQPNEIGPYVIGFSEAIEDGTGINVPGTVLQYIGGLNGGGENNTMTTAFKGAVTELWVAQGHFVNWAVSANRYKFQVTDALKQNYAPCDIGWRGQAPFGYLPTLYLTGGPSSFILNRARGETLKVLLANLSTGLFIVDDPPS